MSEIVKCPLCGTEHMADASDTMGAWKQIRLDTGYCNICSIGEHRARLHASGAEMWNVIVDGKYYSTSESVPLGDPDPRPRAPSWDKGFGGARWDYQPLDGSPPRTTYSLWHGGTVASYMRDRMPDTARFLTRAEADAMLAERMKPATTPDQTNEVTHG